MLRSNFFIVGLTGFEPATSSSRTTRASQLRYSPILYLKKTFNLASLKQPAY